MIAIRIHTNIPHVSGRLKLLPQKFEKKSERIALAWAKAVRKSAKLRSPRDTGTLANNIDYRFIQNTKGNISQKRMVVGVFGKAFRYGRYVERGWTPHWIPVEFIEQHRANPGQKGQWVDNPEGWVLSHPFNTRTGFLSAALDATKLKVQDIIKREFARV